MREIYSHKYIKDKIVLKPNANEEDIINLGKKYGLDIRVLNNVIFIKSCYLNDVWMCEIENSKLRLSHNSSHSNFEKISYKFHFQRYYYDYNYMFWCIRNHDSFKEKNRLAKLFNMIETGSYLHQ